MAELNHPIGPGRAKMIALDLDTIEADRATHQDQALVFQYIAHLRSLLPSEPSATDGAGNVKTAAPADDLVTKVARAYKPPRAIGENEIIRAWDIVRIIGKTPWFNFPGSSIRIYTEGVQEGDYVRIVRDTSPKFMRSAPHRRPGSNWQGEKLTIEEAAQVFGVLPAESGLEQAIDESPGESGFNLDAALGRAYKSPTEFRVGAIFQASEVTQEPGKKPSFSIRLPDPSRSARVWAENTKNGDYVELTKNTDRNRRRQYKGALFTSHLEMEPGRFWEGRVLSIEEAARKLGALPLEHDKTYFDALQEATERLSGIIPQIDTLLGRLTAIKESGRFEGYNGVYTALTHILEEMQSFYKFETRRDADADPRQIAFFRAHGTYFHHMTEARDLQLAMNVERREREGALRFFTPPTLQ
ncbi:MAG: hypothetical protein V1735_02705 [Nanoarchaeota archaeon]